MVIPNYPTIHSGSSGKSSLLQVGRSGGLTHSMICSDSSRAVKMFGAIIPFPPFFPPLRSSSLRGRCNESMAWIIPRPWRRFWTLPPLRIHQKLSNCTLTRWTVAWHLRNGSCQRWIGWCLRCESNRSFRYISMECFIKRVSEFPHGFLALLLVHHCLVIGFVYSWILLWDTTLCDFRIF